MPNRSRMGQVGKGVLRKRKFDESTASQSGRDARDEAEIGAERTESQDVTRSLAHDRQDLVHLRGHQYGNLSVTGSASMHNGDVIHYHSYVAVPLVSPSTTPIRATASNFIGSYAHSSLQPVVNYVSRPKLEIALDDQLPAFADADSGEMRTVVVWGLGGVGKSQLALNYVRAYRQRYQAVFWVQAGQKESVQRDYIQIHKQLFPNTLGDSVTVSLNNAIADVKNWLQNQQKRCLWVMDSADEVEDESSEQYMDLNHYLPEAPQLDRIITTRSSRVQGLSTQEGIAVAEMDEEEAVQLFCRCAKISRLTNDKEQEVRTIVKELGFLALAVMLAGSYVSESPRLQSNLSLYLNDYRHHRKRILSRKARSVVHGYRDSMLSAWEMSFAAIERQDPVAARLLTLLAFVNFDDIFIQLFRPIEPTWTSYGFEPDPNDSRTGRWLKLLSSGEAVIDEQILEACFMLLQAYSMLTWRPQEGYVMHKLVHAWSHDRLDEMQRQDWSLAVLGLLGQVIFDYSGDLATELRLVPHAMANFTAISMAYGSTYEISEQDRFLMRITRDLLRRLGRWSDEYVVQVFLLQATRQALGSEHHETLVEMNILAQSLMNQGRWHQALELYERTLELNEQVLGQDHPNTLTTMSDIGQVLGHLGQYEEAIKRQRQTLELETRIFGPEHPDTLKGMTNLAGWLSENGDHEEALNLHRRALELKLEVLGPEDPSTLTSMNNLALALSEQGEYEESVELHLQTLELDAKILGPEHPQTLSGMNNLALVYARQADFEQAEELYRQTIELKQKVLRPRHPSTWISLDNLAEVLILQGRHEEAERLREDFQAVRQKI